jgi:Zn-dependent M28 family amino/carboxypeptidase
VSIGPRPAGSAALADCRRYILSELKSAGIAAREQPFDSMTPAGVIKMTNIIATIPGRRPERIVLATHYDTKLFREFRFVGASDAASSTAAVLELGRVLKARQNPYTIELLFLDGEEAVNTEWRDPDNTYGSKYYVRDAKQAGTLPGLKALVLLDMVGDRALDIRRDTNSTRWLTDIVWGAAAKLGYGGTFVPDDFAVEDDHLPFLAAGVSSVDIIDLDYPQWHTAADDLDHVSARSLQIVGDVVLAALPLIEKQLASPQR